MSLLKEIYIEVGKNFSLTFKGTLKGRIPDFERPVSTQERRRAYKFVQEKFVPLEEKGWRKYLPPYEKSEEDQ